ncbi:PIG-L family deacetylase [Lentzea aerocolonigenes]|uniref:PIG-L family deacetylase n=1 Tax=Lentzea aerocolonigenes TaxID=68170 RepID=UPI0004C3B870|nr:PIG-L family deacetylase [Lentzea aerocolonigenes]MCP2241629.1 N-acetylglucosaminyl deacetylase, LmbE family [Lentzea aerocolonigenes]
MPKISRRTVLKAGTAAAAVTAFGANIGTAHAAPTGASFVNIIAHSDDDLLFINPDIQPAILSGCPVRTIVLTADEFNGTDNLTREQLSAELHKGQRNAYAALAGVASTWTRTAMVVAGKTVEVNTLDGKPTVQLVYLNLPDGGDDLHEDATKNLWTNTSYSTSTIVPTGSPANRVQTYRHADVVNVLVGLLAQFQPTVVRCQDPFPDDVRYAAGMPDHLDHIHTAKFAQKAVKSYMGPTGRPYALLVRYRCYNTRQAPANVPAALRTPKTNAYNKYKAMDPLSGDVFDVNLSRCYERWPVSPQWATVDSAGTVHAFVVAGDSLMWWRQPNGGAWVGPTTLLAGSFAPGVAVAMRGDNRLQLAVLDLDTAAIRTCTQTAAGAQGFGTWTSLGNPNSSSPAYQTPVFGVSNGSLELYVVNRAGTLGNKWQEGTGFSGWVTVTGGNGKAMSQPSAITAPGGRMHVFADGNGKAFHWYQNVGGTTIYQALTTEAQSTASIGTALDANRVRIFTRRHSDGSVGTLREMTANGSWETTLANIGGMGGLGPVAAVTSGGRTLAFARNNDYGLSMTRQDSAGNFVPWQDFGGYVEVAPSAVVDAQGLVRVFALGADMRLRQRVQTAVGPDAPFGDWQAAGS